MKSRTAVLSLLASVSLALLPPAFAQAPVSAPGYRIGPKDLVAIQVYEVPELNGERRVGENGMINLPQLGDVAAVGLTAEELEARLRELLSRYVQRATVNVDVLEFRSKPITVIGAVRQAGPLAFSGRWTLLEAITAAGGLSEGHGGKIYILRHADNGLVRPGRGQRSRPAGAGRSQGQSADHRQRPDQRPGRLRRSPSTAWARSPRRAPSPSRAPTG